MKYVLRKLNQVQETDSEDRKNELLAKGFRLEKENGKTEEPEQKQGNQSGRTK